MRWTSWFRRRHWEQRMDAEFRFHLESQVRDYLSQGLTREEAAQRARRDFGAVDLAKDECRDRQLFDHQFLEWLRHFLRDLRYALRSLRRSPGFTAAAILTLALGIGANTAVFSVVEAVLLAPLPFRDPDRLVSLRENSRILKRSMSVSFPDLEDWRCHARAFEHLAGSRANEYNLTSPGLPEHLNGTQVSAGYFNLLGVSLALGREFSPQEDRHGGAPVAILSTRLWKDRFAGADILGRTVTLDGLDYTIVGILPPGFRLMGDASDIYTPLGQGDPLWVKDRSIHPGISVLARLNPGVTLSQAGADLAAVQSRLNQLYPATNRGLATDIVPLRQEIVGNQSQILLLLLGAVALVLLIACANVANLLLARSVERAREFAIRAALGAGRARLAAQLLAESLLLSLSGGALGLALAAWGIRPAVNLLAAGLPRRESTGVHLPVLLFTLAISLAVGILFGLAPARSSSNPNLQAALKQGARGSTGDRRRTQHLLVVFQMALTLVLLTGASLLFRTIRNLSEVHPGFDTRHVLTFRVGLSPSLARSASSIRIADQQLTERLRRIPGVQAADITVLVPLTPRSNAGPFWIGSGSPAYISEAPRALFYETGPDYLRTMGIPLLRGRFFRPEDTTGTAPVVVIDSVLARTWFPGRDPVGQTIQIPHWGTARIIGVVAHVRHWGLGDPDLYTQNQIYIPFYQLADEWVPAFQRDVTVAVRTSLDAATLMPAIQAAVSGLASDQPVYAVQSMQQIAAESMSAERFPMLLLAAFAALALLLASVGIYGTVSYSVARRVPEIGIRMALGAGKWSVVRMVVWQGLQLAFAGIALGAAAAMLLTRVLSTFAHLLYGVRPIDPLSFLLVSLVLAASALAACYLPAYRAARLDPLRALRQE